MADIKKIIIGGTTYPVKDDSKQVKIDSSNKLSADLVDDTSATNKFVTSSEKSTWNNKSDFSGSYNDLTDKPTIPQGVVVDNALSSTSENPVQNKVINNALNGKQATIADLNDIRNGAAAGATAYQKPSSGIPKSDLSSAVQTSLGKADTALQSYTESDPVFGASPAAGITSNDITEWDDKAEPTPVVNHGTSDTTFALTPNVLHTWGTVTSLALTLATPVDNTIVNEYMFQFTSGTTATTLSLPSSVVWDEDKGTLTMESGYIYQVSILNNIALWARVAV